MKAAMRAMRLVLLGLVAACAGCGIFAAVEASEDLPCDRAASRDVRRVVKEILMPGSEAALPPDCPISPASDRYRLQEQAKEPLAQGLWRCRECGKRFVGEQHLDRHLASRHPHLELRGANASCVTDWHAALHAHHLVAFLEGVSGWAADPLPCRPAAAAQLQAACLELAARCAPRGQAALSPPLQRLHGLLAARLCAAHTCDKRRKRARLLAVATAHRRQAGSWTIVAASGGVVLAVVWLLLWLVHSEGGTGSAAYRRAVAARRRLVAAAADEGGGLLPSVLSDILRGAGGKRHLH